MFDFSVVTGGERGEDGDCDPVHRKECVRKVCSENTENPYTYLSSNFSSVYVFCLNRNNSSNIDSVDDSVQFVTEFILNCIMQTCDSLRMLIT